MTPEQKSYVVGRIRAISLEIDDDLIDFDGLEASDGNIQTLLDEKVGKLRKLDVKAVPIPARIFGDLVLGQEQCALLGLALGR